MAGSVDVFSHYTRKKSMGQEWCFIFGPQYGTITEKKSYGGEL
jgi:hypothetical protein